MKYYNATQAAKVIGISDKTLRRWLAKGRITAKRTQSGKLAIASSEVERARLEWEQEQAQFAESSTISDDMDMPRQVTDLTARVTELEKKLAALETHLSDRSQNVREQPRHVQAKSIALPHDDDDQKRTSSTNSPIPADLPPGTLSSS